MKASKIFRKIVIFLVGIGLPLIPILLFRNMGMVKEAPKPVPKTPDKPAPEVTAPDTGLTLKKAAEQLNMQITEFIRQAGINDTTGLTAGDLERIVRIVQEKKSADSIQAEVKAEKPKPRKKAVKKKALRVKVNSSMTLEETAKKYNMPVDYLKMHLMIPVLASNKSSLEKLGKMYDFTLADVKAVVRDYRR